MQRTTPEKRISEILKKSGQTLGTAESCTGGRIAHRITTVSGSSSYFLGAVVSYAIAVKENILGVPASVIEKNGVVSSEVAQAMAKGVRKVLHCDWAVATTGLAEGGDENYPEGTVWMAVSGPDISETRIYYSKSDRKGNIRNFTGAALRFLAEIIGKNTR